MTRPRSKKALETEANVKKAFDGLSSGLYTTPYQARKALGLSKGTMSRRINGGKSRAEAREKQQTLSKAEEKALEGWITRLTATGHPAQHDFIRDMAEEIKNQRSHDSNDFRDNIPIPITWVPQFLQRHPHLKTTLSRCIEAARIKDVTPDAIMNWFRQLQEIIEENQITFENVYNMDETGITDINKVNNRVRNRYNTNCIRCS